MEINIAKTFRTLIALVGVAGCVAFAAPASAQKAYPTAAAAADALVDGIARHDPDAIKAAIGADYRRYIPLASIDSDDITGFLAAWSSSHGIEQVTPDRAYLRAGRFGWTLPIPIVRSEAGWRFDTKAAPREIRARRIGRNELAAILVALAYTDAQEEYFARNPEQSVSRHFAHRALSSPGKRDGLYWASAAGERESPAGPLLAEAKPGQAYHGYRYRILTAQGKDAPGGAKSYVRNGLMTDGYALIAWPERYGDTGVMTFIVSRDGVVHQKNLGPQTPKLAAAVSAYNPDSTWEKVVAR